MRKSYADRRIPHEFGKHDQEGYTEYWLENREVMICLETEQRAKVWDDWMNKDDPRLGHIREFDFGYCGPVDERIFEILDRMSPHLVRLVPRDGKGGHLSSNDQHRGRSFYIDLSRITFFPSLTHLELRQSVDVMPWRLTNLLTRKAPSLRSLSFASDEERISSGERREWHPYGMKHGDECSCSHADCVYHELSTTVLSILPAPTLSHLERLSVICPAAGYNTVLRFIDDILEHAPKLTQLRIQSQVRRWV